MTGDTPKSRRVSAWATKLDLPPLMAAEINKGILGWTGIPDSGSKEVCGRTLPSLIGRSSPV